MGRLDGERFVRLCGGTTQPQAKESTWRQGFGVAAQWEAGRLLQLIAASRFTAALTSATRLLFRHIIWHESCSLGGPLRNMYRRPRGQEVGLHL